VAGRRARHARRSGRARSQHFLRSNALAAELVHAAGVSAHDLVLEIGAGDGRLTAELARAARRVIAVEIDPRWAARLRGRWPNVDVVQKDAFSLELPHDPFVVVANLPFDRTADALRHLLDDPRAPLVRAHLIVQWGVALKRASIWPSTLNGVLWGAWWTFRLDRRLPANAFDPPPSVDAGVLAVERRLNPLVAEADRRAYRAFVARGFRHGLRAVAPPRLLRRLRLRSAVPRDLDVHQWAALFTSGKAGRLSRTSAPLTRSSEAGKELRMTAASTDPARR
jgi:23S rRNA (adenine-N6)-dimethyltransferase